MKYVVTESKLNNAIYQYLDTYLEPNQIDWVYGTKEGELDYIDDENFLIFFKGDWVGEYSSEIVFNYFNEDYYGDGPSSKSFKNAAPILEVMNEYGKHLDTMFDKHWEEPMRKWFQDNFNLPVKTIWTYY